MVSRKNAATVRFDLRFTTLFLDLLNFLSILSITAWMAYCRRTMRAEVDSPLDVHPHPQTVVAPVSELLAERFRRWRRERLTKPTLLVSVLRAPKITWW